MADIGDAEWVGVDFEFGKPGQTTTTQRPRPRPATTRPRPPVRPRVPATEPPHEMPEVERPATNPTGGTNSAALTAGVIGGILGLVLILLIVYMFVLRKRLRKAKAADGDSQYQLRVEDVAHINNLDESSNLYVNTTDLQKLMSTVRAKQKTDERPPPRPINSLTPSRPPFPNQDKKSSDNNGFTADSDVVTVMKPVPLPHNALNETTVLHRTWESPATPQEEVVYSNLTPEKPFVLSTPPTKAIETPKIAPPPPAKPKRALVEETKPLSPTVIARPAPPPPKAAILKSADSSSALQPQKPVTVSKPPPPSAPKPSATWQQDANLEVNVSSKPSLGINYKPSSSSTSTKPTPKTNKPNPPTLPKPGVMNRSKNLPPLKVALLPPQNKTSLDSCSTPDTGVLEMTPESTPVPVSECNIATGSISSKIAFLEGKMKTPVLPVRALHPKP
ncbi:hypothetical protein SK128_007257 [Halocaridina rubra]|uniref:Uncharacterized protein n=1 Tax=Halocaridina rubra TaxID=373956 RepID=A0AAN8X3R2_HALRR